ncbi:hypothetical protein OAI81_02290 [Candidatus Pelagibacter sp.]|nr:hypothetical protein [Candidatus Pelagibacter sp.]
MYIQFIFLILLSISLIIIQSKYFFLIDRPKNQQHKLAYNKNIPLSGGIYFFIAILTNTLLTEYYDQNFLIIIFLFLFLILGIYSDLITNFTPRIRLLCQIALVILIIVFLDLKIDKTNVFFLDYYIDNKIFNLFFTSFCILVLINGSNFCDGINCNVSGYYLIIVLAIFFTGLPLPITFLNIETIIIIFLVFYIFNLFQKFFLGDNGVYVISIFMSIYVIKFINFNSNISSLLALNLLWYPAFENLFTIVRRTFTKKKIQTADRSHLHILIFEKILNRNNLIISNSLAGILLNIFMFIGIFSSIKFYDNSKILILILMINITIYIIGYYYLLFEKRNLNRNKKTIKKTDNKTDVINK